MSRSLLLSAIAAAAVCGLWGLATRSSGSLSARPSAPVECTESAPMVPEEGISTVPVPGIKPATVSKVRIQPSVRERRTAPARAVTGFRSAMRITGDGQPDAPAEGPALTVEEMQAMARKEAEGLVTIHNPDGSETLNHEGRFTDYAVIRIGPDGKRMFECVQGEDALKRALPPTASASSKKGGN